jgi:hypothetical protein
MFRPPPQLTVSEWADATRVLGPNSPLPASMNISSQDHPYQNGVPLVFSKLAFEKLGCSA